MYNDRKTMKSQLSLYLALARIEIDLTSIFYVHGRKKPSWEGIVIGLAHLALILLKLNFPAATI